MINHADIENIIGCKTLVTDRMQQAIEGWYDAAINGLPLSRDPETLSLGLPAVICSELARLTTLELDAKVEGSPRADWVNTQLQRVLAPADSGNSPSRWRWAAASGSLTRVAAASASASATPASIIR